MSNLFKLACLFYMIHGFQNAMGQTLYSMEDLAVLAKEKNYDEYFSHALDIKPSERNQLWTNQTEQLGIDHLSNLMNKTKLTKDDYKLVHKLSKWPIFRENEFFNKKRDHIFLRQIKECFISKNEECISLAKNIYNDYKHDLVFSFDISTLLKLNGVQNNDLWSFSSVLIKDPLSEFYCGKSPFSDTVLEFLSNKEKSKLIHKDCLKALKPKLEKGLLSSNQWTRQASFAHLKNKKLLTKKDRYRFAILTFLYNPEVSPQEIDNTLESLQYYSRNLNERENLKSEISSLDPLPDGIFLEKSNKKLTAKLRTLNRFFPEFFSLYTNKCLNYLTGKKTYKNGNPTPNCHKLFSSKEIQTILPDNKIQQYKKATFFIK